MPGVAHLIAHMLQAGKGFHHPTSFSLGKRSFGDIRHCSQHTPVHERASAAAFASCFLLTLTCRLFVVVPSGSGAICLTFVL